ncbi:hypothetical protein M2317_002023 [Microbacterium sp. ZKA21]|uniref:hypothetical protein n=1 Tax=Microbacterium sp. ZKA21 TaxID=3381694 RepID=UPI003D1A2A2A
MRSSARFRAAVAGAAVAVLASLGLAGSAVAATVPMAAPVVTAVSGGELSDSGNAAIADLRACLASQSTLNVYYLIDSSTSLRRADGGGPGSDPDTVRAQILGNSLAQLGALDDDITVNWGAGFFASDYSASIGWQAYDDASPEKLAETIRQKRPEGYTNWPDALAGAQQQLAGQQSAAPGCQMLIWLTDGALDIQAPDGQQQEDFDALNAMCGAPLSDRGATPSGYGVFNTFRQSGVVVVGALLAVGSDAADAAPTMQTLVEGSEPGADPVCGQQPMPDTFVHGAFVNADGPDALSLVFLQLSAQVAGGFPQPFDEDGGFWIDEGVSRFRVIVSDDWTLTPPEGSGRSPLTAGDAEGADVTESDGASTIEVVVDGDDAEGRWQLEAANRASASLYLFSDLRIEFDDVNEIEMSPDGSFAAALNATVRDAEGDAVDLGRFGEAAFTASYLADGARTVLPEATVDPESGRITIPLPADVNAATIDVAASIDPLRTQEHDLQLAPVTTQKTITLTLGAQFPHAVTNPPARLSDLEGSDGKAEGVVTILGPTEGGDGTVCVAADAVAITSDAGDRADAWRWSFAGLDENGCITVPQNGEVQIPVTAANEIAADSDVAAAVPITFTSANGESVEQNVPLEFRSTHPVNTAAVLLLALALLAIGLLLPLLVLWVLNWLTTRIDVPKSTQRAAFPIEIAPAGVQITAPNQGSALSDAFAYRSPSDGERSISDPVLGTLRARVPWFPLRAPWYDVTAPTGMALITARAGRMVTGSKDTGRRLRFAKLPLDRFFGIVVPEAELRRTARGDAVTGTVVIYHRASPSDQGQHAQRLAEITVDSTLAEAVNRARADLVESDRSAAPVGARRGSGTPRSEKASATASAPAPRPSSDGAAPPPLPGRAQGSSAPPARGGGSATPPRSGGPGTPPPPRPVTPPPPRP